MQPHFISHRAATGFGFDINIKLTGRNDGFDPFNLVAMALAAFLILLFGCFVPLSESVVLDVNTNFTGFDNLASTRSSVAQHSNI